MKNNLLQIMESDMHLSPYTDELHKYFVGRLFYSGLAQWLRVVTLDEIYGEVEPKSKVYILNRGREIISHLVMTIPESKDYFINGEGEFIADEVVKDLREKMLLAGELVETGEQRKVTVSQYIEEKCVLGYNRMRGIGASEKKYEYIGITRICNNPQSDESQIVTPRVDCIKFVEWLFSNATWTELRDPNQYEFFDPTINKSPHQSWNNKPSKLREYHIGRLSSYNGLYEYYLIKFKNGNWYNAPFSSVLHEFKEERRVYLALRKKYNNSMSANYEYKGKVVILNLFCRLPIKEEILLDTFCWPLKRFDDKLNYVISYKVWNGIKDILENDLGIMMREKM